MKGEYITKSGGLIDANLEESKIDVSDMENIELILVQVTDAGTVVLVTEKSADGVVWQTVDASSIESDWGAGNNLPLTAGSFALSDANGMPLRTKFVRTRATALAGGGVYKLMVAGQSVL